MLDFFLTIVIITPIAPKFAQTGNKFMWRRTGFVTNQDEGIIVAKKITTKEI
jgi:hypothetical protein